MRPLPICCVSTDPGFQSTHSSGCPVPRRPMGNNASRNRTRRDESAAPPPAYPPPSVSVYNANQPVRALLRPARSAAHRWLPPKAESHRISLAGHLYATATAVPVFTHVVSCLDSAHSLNMTNAGRGATTAVLRPAAAAGASAALQQRILPGMEAPLPSPAPSVRPACGASTWRSLSSRSCFNSSCSPQQSCCNRLAMSSTHLLRCTSSSHLALAVPRCDTYPIDQPWPTRLGILPISAFPAGWSDARSLADLPALPAMLRSCRGSSSFTAVGSSKGSSGSAF